MEAVSAKNEVAVRTRSDIASIGFVGTFRFRGSRCPGGPRVGFSVPVTGWSRRRPAGRCQTQRRGGKQMPVGEGDPQDHGHGPPRRCGRIGAGWTPPASVRSENQCAVTVCVCRCSGTARP